MVVGCSSVPDGSDSVIGVRIDENTRYQTVEHFGASAAWWAQCVGQWPEDTAQRMMNLLYGSSDGIGLDIIRYNLGGGKKNAILTDQLRTVESPETSPLQFDWSRDAAAIGVVQKAVDLGAKVIVFANSPPDRLTITGAPTGNATESNLLPGKEAEFAEYIVAAVQSLEGEYGWEIEGLSPINEPQWNWAPKNGQEGCHYSPEEAYRVVRAVYDELKRKNVHYDISAVDSAEMKLASNMRYLDLLMQDEDLRCDLDHYAVHSYWSSEYDRRQLSEYVEENYPGLSLWMSEWTEMESGRDYGMDSALMLAATVLEDFNFAGVTSWQYWIAASPYNYRDGLIYIDPRNESFRTTKRLFALGNFSKFIQSGATRVDCAFSVPYKLQGGAFKNPDDSLVVTLVNMNKTEPRNIDFAITGAGYSQMTIYETSPENDLALCFEGKPKEYTIGPESIQTIIFR